MDELEPAREIIVATIATLETLMDALMSAQAPQSTRDDVLAAIRSMRTGAHELSEAANMISFALDIDDS